MAGPAARSGFGYADDERIWLYKKAFFDPDNPPEHDREGKVDTAYAVLAALTHCRLDAPRFLDIEAQDVRPQDPQRLRFS